MFVSWMPSASATKNMVPSMLLLLLALLFGTSLFVIHGTTAEGVSSRRVNVLLLHDASTVHVWVRPVKKGEVAKVYLCPPAEAGTIEQSGQLVAECKQYSSDLWHDLIEINGKPGGVYTLTWTETTHASLVYVFEPQTVLEQGIRILFIGEEAKLPNLEGSYHFRAPFGWNSDTCGFNRSNDGLYHLFYQHFPHAVQWYSMHWGHAVSKDLIQLSTVGLSERQNLRLLIKNAKKNFLLKMFEFGQNGSHIRILRP